MAASTPRLKITVLSPLAPRKAYATTGAPPLRAFTPDGGIDGLLGQIPVGLKIEVSDPFGGSAAKLRVDLTFKGPKSFRPDGIVAQVPALRGLAEVPGRLRELSARKASRSDIVRDLAQVLPSAAWAEVLAPTSGAGGGAAAPAAPAPSSGSSSIDDILSHTGRPRRRRPPRSRRSSRRSRRAAAPSRARRAWPRPISPRARSARSSARSSTTPRSAVSSAHGAARGTSSARPPPPSTSRSSRSTTRTCPRRSRTSSSGRRT